MKPGETIAGRFRIERPIGSGSMGDVYRAKDTQTGAAVAMKVLRNESHAERFAREARVLAQLAHPAIVGYVDHGDSWLAMEWLDGESLQSRLATQPLRVRETTAIVKRVAEALAAAHGAGVVHRDVKPSNVFLCKSGDVKLLDFGVARARDRHRTASGVVIGTLSYMAPEQARGQKDVDARADVFALGCVLYECLTGTPPFRGKTALDIRIAVISTEPPRMRQVRPELPSDFDLIVNMMLSKNPADRLFDAKAIGKALGQLAHVDGDAPGPSFGAAQDTESGAMTAPESRHIA